MSSTFFFIYTNTEARSTVHVSEIQMTRRRSDLDTEQLCVHVFDVVADERGVLVYTVENRAKEPARGLEREMSRGTLRYRVEVDSESRPPLWTAAIRVQYILCQFLTGGGSWVHAESIPTRSIRNSEASRLWSVSRRRALLHPSPTPLLLTSLHSGGEILAMALYPLPEEWV